MDFETMKMWAETVDFAVTVCDLEGKILFMNERSRETFARHGDIIGHDLFRYHPPHAQAKIREMLADGTSNTYTISKAGQRKMIHQTPWRDAEGRVAGLVEISVVVPEDAPHYVR